MIVLDTNVLSEALRSTPSPAVMRWLSSLHAEMAFTTAISEAEMLRGVELLPAGRRKSLLSAAVSKVFWQEFRDRILPFDDEAAPAYATIVIQSAKAGRPISQSDAMIAAICKSRKATLATRNVKDFEHCEIEVMDPWSSRGSARY